MSELVFPAYSGSDHESVGLAMTAAAFQAAQNAGLTSFEPNINGMATLAQEAGANDFLTPHDKLRPLMILIRTSVGRENLGSWDARAPRTDAGQTDRYFSGIHLDQERPATASRDKLARHARTLGVTALTEVDIATWDSDASYREAFILALFRGQRPLDPPKRSAATILNRVYREIVDTPASQGQQRTAARIGRNTTLPEPFILRRQDTAGALPPPTKD